MSCDGRITTIASALQQARAAGVERLDAQLLLSQVLGCERTWLLAHDDKALGPEQAQRYAAALTQRADGVPLAYLLGTREFHGLRLRVTPDVLDPRPDTETLVEWALSCLAELGEPQPDVLDLGTGSGAIALAMAHAWPQARVTATDASAAALAVAQGNATELGLTVDFHQGSWWQGLQGRRWHLVLSNPPYIAGHDAHLQALRHEPRMALTPEGDGLDALREIIRQAPEHLQVGGWLLLEHGHDQAEAVAELLAAAGFQGVEHRLDLAGHSRCTGGRVCR